MLTMRILGLGICQAKQKVTSAELDKRLNLTEGYIESFSGVSHRFFADTEDSQAKLAADAVRDAAKNANIELNTIDLLISASAVPLQAIPSTACFIHNELSLPDGIPAFDINASCLSFVVALYTAMNYLQAGDYRRIAIVASDLASRGLNWQDLHSASILGDGAAAIIIEKADDRPSSSEHGYIAQCLAYNFETYPEGRHFCEIRAGGTGKNPVTGMEELDFKFSMDGRAVFKIAMQKMNDFMDRLLAKAKLEYDAINHAAIHQASHLGMQHAIKRMKFRENTITNIYPEHGNQVSASIPTALYYIAQQNGLVSGKKVALLGTAAGFSMGGMVLEII